MMKSFLTLLLALSAAYAQNAVPTCGSGCLPNYVQCVTSTSYKACINGQVFEDTQTCKEGTFCSDGPTVCLPANATNVQFVCGTDENGGGAGSCNVCDEGDTFTCVDRTHFTMCSNRDAYVPCVSGQVCSKELLAITNSICVLETALGQIGLATSCSNTVTTTTLASTVGTTPSYDTAVSACMKNKPSTAVSYFFLPNVADTSCRTYFYCEVDGKYMDGRVLTCKAGKWYDHSKKSCVTGTAASGCDSASTTASPQ